LEPYSAKRLEASILPIPVIEIYRKVLRNRLTVIVADWMIVRGIEWDDLPSWAHDYRATNIYIPVVHPTKMVGLEDSEGADQQRTLVGAFQRHNLNVI